MNSVSLSRLATPEIVADIREGLRQATAAARNSIQNFSRKSFGTTKFFTNFAVLITLGRKLNLRGAGQTPGHTTGYFCARLHKAITAVISNSNLPQMGLAQECLATGYDSRFSVSNAKHSLMMNSVSLSRAAAPGIAATLRDAWARSRAKLSKFSAESFGTTKFFTNFAVRNNLERKLSLRGAGQTPGHTTGYFCARLHKASTAAISISNLPPMGLAQDCFATGYDSRFSVSKAKQSFAMNNVSLSRAAAPGIAATLRDAWTRSRAKLSKAAAPMAYTAPALTFIAIIAEAEACASALAILSMAAIGLANHKTESTKITKTLKNA